MTGFRTGIASVAILWAFLWTGGTLHSGASPEREPAGAPQYTSDGKLKLPGNYREWIYLSTGLGMSYSDRSRHSEPVFDNVFVKRESYDRFLRTGTWPDRTMFVLELRVSSDHGSILKDGRFQAGISSIEASVKDEGRFPEKWAYFDFGASGTEAMALPKEACFSCHRQNGAVDNTFVQFYPTLLNVARRTGGSPR